MATVPAGDFGSGLGGIVGGVLANDQLKDTQKSVDATTGAGLSAVGTISNDFKANTEPYDSFGKSFLPTATDAIGGVQTAAGQTQGYNQFMSTYTNTPAAEYQLQQADAVQNNSAAATGKVLSGSNERALATINNGIVAGNANTAYNEYLAGNNQQFGQLETALGNMFSAIGVGQTATGQQAGVDTSQIGATSAITGANIGATSKIGEAEAKNDQGKGSGLGSMFAGIPIPAF